MLPDDSILTWDSSNGDMSLDMSVAHVKAICKPGKNDPAVAAAVADPAIQTQLKAMDLEDMRNNLRESGVDDTENMDEDRIFNHFVWLAAWDIFEAQFE